MHIFFPILFLSPVSLDAESPYWGGHACNFRYLNLFGKHTEEGSETFSLEGVYLQLYSTHYQCKVLVDMERR